MNARSREIEKSMAAFRGLCRAHGLRATHQRMVIYRKLAATREHPDADTLYRRVRKLLPSISFDTVYRTLRMLENKRAVSRVAFIQDRMRFDANTAPHHHFVCNACGRVMDFYSAELDRVPRPPEAPAIGRIDSIHIELRGICRDCRNNNRKSA